MFSANLLALFAVTPAVALAQATFTPMGDLPGAAFGSGASAVNEDGTVVVGVGDSPFMAESEAARWTAATGWVGLGDLPGGAFHSAATDVSADGNVICGNGTTEAWSPFGPQEAFLWTAGGGMVGLGGLASPVNSRAFAISDDGTTIVGVTTTAAGNEAFRWTQATGMVSLGDLPGGAVNSRAESVSADGSVVVGYATTSSGREAFRWTAATGMTSLGFAPGDTSSGANHVSPDGRVVVGQTDGPLLYQALRWSAGSGAVGLGPTVGGSLVGNFATACDAYGSVVVGSAWWNELQHGLLWTPELGVTNLLATLVSSGAPQAAGWWLYPADITTDGRTVVGWGVNPSGQSEAWIATLPPLGPSSFCTAGTTSSGCVASIASSGLPSASEPSGFVITVSSVEGRRSGLIFYGLSNPGFSPLPWGASTSYLCVKPPTQRTLARDSGGTSGQCDGALELDWNAFVANSPSALGAPFSAGDACSAQAWFRDPPSPKSTHLSNALRFVLAP
jgi:probable HAF family extracellular repeat protein